MLEMLTNARAGWLDLLEAGKLIGLLLVVMTILAFLSLIGMKRKSWIQILLDMGNMLCPEVPKKGIVLIIYTAVMLFLCICPVTAVFLMFYQTKFYDYYWVYSYVPVTVMLALAVGAVLELIWRINRSRKGIMKAGAATVFILFILFLCGAGRGQGQDSTPVNDYKKTALLLENIQREMGEERVCLWAPGNIMASARRVTPEVMLLYGRGVWDRALGAYSYDEVEPWMEDLYQWMEEVNTGAEWKEEYLEDIREALGRGANVIILSKNTWQELRDKVAEYTNSVAVESNDVYIFYVSRHFS